jgi:hypothetical protein
VSAASTVPLFSKSRFLFALYAPIALLAAVALPLTWTRWDGAGTGLLLWLEGVVLSLGFVLADPERFAWVGRVLMGLVAAMGLGLAVGAPSALRGAERWGLVVFALPCAWYALRGRFLASADREHDAERDSGRLSLDGERLRYEHPPHDAWELAVVSIEAIGELTLNTLGPDYFLCFVTDGGRTWVTAPTGAAGAREALDALEERLGPRLDFGLANRIEFASRVLWPAQLGGRELFELGEKVPLRWFPWLSAGREYHVAPDVAAGLERPPT